MRYAGQSRDFTVEIVSSGPTAVVITSGEVDMLTSPRLEEAIEHAAARRPPRLVVDMSTVEFIDSAGLRVLLAAVPAVPELRVVASPAVRRLLSMAGLSETIRVVDRVGDPVTAQPEGVGPVADAPPA
ncbi:STAS domain-containing protein [Nocardia blacklockiae]|uniref:STAS domain-containing protein n=1 Tax=Nocardia blacklockiae TaxID=480036 RepID=UPI002B4AE9D7|nr:STAS domain-containing protein [Nocardia blacklockiae]